MAERSADEIRADLLRLRDEFDRLPELLEKRAQLVEEARETMTWRETASLLGMTEAGLRKHQRAYEERQHPKKLAS